jgi:hypothetical protein
VVWIVETRTSGLKHVLLIIGILAVTALASCDSAIETDRLPDEVTIQHGLLRFRGEVVHPGAFRDLSTVISDTIPVAVAVDLEGCMETEKYGSAAPEIDGGLVSASDDLRIAYFKYEYLGVLPNGIHVVRTYECGGGSGVFISLLLVRFASGMARDGDKCRKRVVMECVGEIGMGDRNYGEVTLEGNGVRIAPYSGPSDTLSYPQERFIDLGQVP